MASLFSLISKLLIGLIRCYQIIISPLIWPHCRFQMTCSQYGIEMIYRFGFLKGSWLALKRILKCHPWYVGLHDFIPIRTLDNREQ